MFSETMKLSLLITLFSITAAASETGDDISTNLISDAEDILTRSKRSATPDVCKYRKGEWSPCDDKVMVS